MAYKTEGDLLTFNIEVTLFKDDVKVYENKNVKGQYNKADQTLTYWDEVLTKITINEQELIFARIDDEYKFSLKIGQTNSCDIYLQKEDLLLNIEVEKALYNRGENYIEIIYKIESDDALNKVVIVKN